MARLARDAFLFALFAFALFALMIFMPMFALSAELGSEIPIPPAARVQFAPANPPVVAPPVVMYQAAPQAQVTYAAPVTYARAPIGPVRRAIFNRRSAYAASGGCGGSQAGYSYVPTTTYYQPTATYGAPMGGCSGGSVSYAPSYSYAPTAPVAFSAPTADVFSVAYQSAPRGWDCSSGFCVPR